MKEFLVNNKMLISIWFWVFLFGFKFETKFLSFYINGVFKTYRL